MKEQDLAVKNGEILVNVEGASTVMLIAVFMDISDEMMKRCDDMPDELRKEYLRAIENIGFCE